LAARETLHQQAHRKAILAAVVLAEAPHMAAAAGAGLPQLAQTAQHLLAAMAAQARHRLLLVPLLRMRAEAAQVLTLPQHPLALAARAAAATGLKLMALMERLALPIRAAAVVVVPTHLPMAALVGQASLSYATPTLMLTQRQQLEPLGTLIQAGTKFTRLRDRGASRSNGKLRATQRKLNRH